MTSFSVDPMLGFGIALTAGAYILSLLVRKRYSSPLTTPVLFSTIIVIAILLLCGVSFEEYAPAKQTITTLLGPATVALALPLYKNRQIFFRNLLPASCGLVAGSLGTMMTAGLIAHAFAFTPELTSSISVRAPPVRAADRLDAAREGRPPRRAARPARGVGEERDGEPDPLLQGPRRLRRARPCAGARLRDDRVRLDRQPRQRGRRARRRRRAARLRADPGRPRGGEDPRHRRLRGDRGRGQGQLRRRQPALHRARRATAPTGPSSTSTCGPTTPRAPRPSASRSPSSSAGSCPTASSRRSPPARCSRRSRAPSRSGSTAGCWRASCRR